jgi:hypothetical protein
MSLALISVVPSTEKDEVHLALECTRSNDVARCLERIRAAVFCAACVHFQANWMIEKGKRSTIDDR